MNTELVLLDKLTKAIAYTFRDDKTAPGVTVASLPKGQYYCSVVRYSAAFGKDKKVVCSATAPTLAAALRAIADEFLNTPSQLVKNPVDELKDAVKGS
jgi:hypothetical protein